MNLSHLNDDEQNRVLWAMHQLRRTPNFETLLTFLAGSLAQSDSALRNLDGPALHRQQGESIALDELLRLIETSSTVLRQRNYRGDL